MNKLKKKICALTCAISVMGIVMLSSCKSNNYKVKFETFGGNEIDAAVVKKGSEYTLPTDSIRDGFIFDGWYSNPECTGDRIITITVNENMTLYAKWVEAYSITLDLDGGSYSGEMTILGKSGASVKSLVEGITPTKSGCKFGNWFLNETEITDNTKLSKNITLKAKYKYKYVVNVNKEKLDGEGYEVETIEEYAYAGQKVSFADTFEGFSYLDTEDTVDEIVISDSSDNSMKVYLSRDSYVVTIRSNYPIDGMEEEKVAVSLVYGEEKQLPDTDFKCDGYYLAGYSTSPNGEVLYDSHFFDNKAINEDPVDETTIKIKANNNMSLYAVWVKGYTDMFGGSDTIFTAEDSKVYLYRNGVYFKGDLLKDNKFIFLNEEENLQGQIYDDGTFVYTDMSRAEFSAVQYVVGSGLNQDCTIILDEYNGLTYSRKVDEVMYTSKGTYTIDQNGYYIATFYEGELENQSLTLIFGSVNVSGTSSVTAFQVRDTEEVELGRLVRFAVYNSGVTYYNYYDIILSGFGTLLYNTGSGYSYYYYTYDKEANLLTMMSSSGSVVGIAKILTINGKKGYFLYDSSLDNTYTNEDGSTLVLDGMYKATYTKDGVTVTGNYETKKSVFGGNIVTFNANGKTYTFLTKTTVESNDENTESITKYSFELKPNGYSEYYYKDGEGIYYSPLVVLNDKEEGKANVYGYTSTKNYVLVLEGKYTYSEETKLYTYVVEKFYETDAFTTPVDYSTIKSFIFNLDTTSTSYQINYWYEYTTNEDVIIDNSVNYESSDARLTLVEGIAIYKRDGMVITGTYETDAETNITTISANGGYIYIIINEEEKTFVTLEHAPVNAYVVTEDGTYSNKEYVELDGLGNAVYVYYVTEGEESVQKKITGTVNDTKESTKQGLNIYEFVSDEKNFTYILISNSKNQMFILPYFEEYSGTYEGTDGILYLDGYQYYASYIDNDGIEYVGMYSKFEDKVIRMYTDDGYRYFDIEGRTFTARGLEYGTYLLRDNQGFVGVYIELNGYGKATIFKYETVNEESVKVVVDANATYSKNKDKFTISYNDGEAKTYVGYLGTYTYSNSVYNVFDIEHSETAYTFIDLRTWTVLELDSKGNAKKTNNKGITVTGQYMIISDSLLYFVNEDGTDANIYKYNKEDMTILEARYSATGYYTSDLKSLLFTKYGFAIFENTTRYYYDIIDGNVYIYHHDAENPNANQYGFVQENFGKFDSVKEYKGETYYINDGFAIAFERKEDTKDLYPVLVSSEIGLCPIERLTFTPSGSDTFSVSGTVHINGQNYNCTVVRELNEADEYVMYVKVSYYRFYITATYLGLDETGNSASTYEVTGLSFVREFPSYNYLNNYYLYYIFLGANAAASYKNNLGTISFIKTYDEFGELKDDYAKVTFLDGTTAYDLNGELLTANNVKYEYDEETKLYTIELTSTDGYKYKVYFLLSLHQSFNQYAYRVLGVVREEVVKSGDYELTVERIIFTDASYEVGSLFSAVLKQNGTEIKNNLFYTYKEVLHYIERQYDETDKLTATNYYLITFTVNDGIVDENAVKPYSSMTIEKKAANTYFDVDGKDFIDVVDGNVKLISVNGTKYIVSESTYDEATKTYTVVLASGIKYSVKVNDDSTIIVTLVEEEEK